MGKDHFYFFLVFFEIALYGPKNRYEKREDHFLEARKTVVKICEDLFIFFGNHALIPEKQVLKLVKTFLVSKLLNVLLVGGAIILSFPGRRIPSLHYWREEREGKTQERNHAAEQIFFFKK